jgi:hypothetical protein
VLGCCVRLVGVSISSEKNFYRLPFIAPLFGRQFRSFNWYQNRFRSLLTLANLRSKDGIPGTGFGSSTLQWEELPDVAEADGSVPPQIGSDPLGCHSEHSLCSSCELPCSRIEGHVRRQQQGGRLPVPCSVLIRIRSG